MNSVMKIFNYGNKVVRTAGTPENPMFCVQDICQVLGVKNHHNKVALLTPDEKDGLQTLDSIGRRQRKVFCTEPGFYRITFSVQNNAITEPFKHWVFHEVLPAIRKTGKFEVQQLRLEHKEQIAEHKERLEQLRFVLINSEQELAQTLEVLDDANLEVHRRLFLVIKNAVAEWRTEQGFKFTDSEWRMANFGKCCSALLGTIYYKGSTPYVYPEYMPNAHQAIKHLYDTCQRNPPSVSQSLDIMPLEYYYPPA